jgi:hypothetical protein
MQKIVISYLWFFIFISPVYAAGNLSSFQSVINYGCVSPMVIGPCPKPDPPFIGIKIRYWEPVLLVETVKTPGDTVINEFAPFLKEATANTSEALINGSIGLPVGVSSGSGRDSVSGVNLQFNEAHVYKFPFDFQAAVQMALTCPATPQPAINIIYLSELDSAEWRIGLLEEMSPKSLLSASLGPICSVVSDHIPEMCMGTWGAVYPRRGFITHSSEVVGSAADVFRAVSISSIADPGLHIKVSPALFSPDSSRDKLQLISPHPSGCVPIGQNPAIWEAQNKAVDGKYLWVYWRYRECCVY